MTESPGQRIVREWLQQHQPSATPGPEDFLFADEQVDLAARIDALVKRERAAVLREAAQAMIGLKDLAGPHDDGETDCPACNRPLIIVTHLKAWNCAVDHVADWLGARAAEEEARNE